MRLAASQLQCVTCKQWKPVDEFPTRADRRTGRPIQRYSKRPQCRVCFGDRRRTLRRAPSSVTLVRDHGVQDELILEPPRGFDAEQSRADLRAGVARFGLRLYAVAAAAKMHPGTLGRLLNGRRPLNAEGALRILSAIKAVVEGRART